MELVTLLQEILKFPFFMTFKFFIVTPLNLFPSAVWEIHGVQGFDKQNRSDLRAIKTKIQGKRKLKFGCALIAYLKGQIIKAHLNTDGKWCWGIYEEDFDEIVKKWTF